MKNAYLIFTGTNISNYRDFNNALQKVTSKVEIPGIPHAYLVYSDLALENWYEAVGNVTNADGGTARPLILPIVTELMTGVRGLPSFLGQFVQSSKTQAA